MTGAAALGSGQSSDLDEWLPAFLHAIAREAADGFDLLTTMERRWFEARQGIAGQRKTSHAAAAVDVLAAAPVLSATTLARILGIAVKNAIRILDEPVTAEIAIEVTHRAKRRLFSLKGLSLLRDAIRPPYRPDPNRGRGRPRHETEDDVPDAAPSPLPAPPEPLTAIERRTFDYAVLEEAMAHLDAMLWCARPDRPCAAFRLERTPPAPTARTPRNGIKPTAIHSLTVPGRRRPASVTAWSMRSPRRKPIRTYWPP